MRVKGAFSAGLGFSDDCPFKKAFLQNVVVSLKLSIAYKIYRQQNKSERKVWATYKYTITL